MTTRRVLRLVFSGAAGAVLLLAAYVFVLFDPFGWGVVRSRAFTWEKFAAVKRGDQIETVIARLGEPVRKPYDFAVITKDPTDPCVNGGCKEYIFAGANWAASYKEAIVITDRNGRVIHAQARQE